jgi:hypothetical protein
MPRRRWGGEEVLLLILDLGTWSWVVSVMPQLCFSPGERTSSTHCTGGWVGPRAGLDTEARGKILSPLLGIEPQLHGRPARSQTLYWLSYQWHQWIDLLNQIPEVYTTLTKYIKTVLYLIILILLTADTNDGLDTGENNLQERLRAAL